MSSISSPALADLVSDLSEPECGQSRSVKSSPTAAPSSASTGPTCRSGKTFDDSRQLSLDVPESDPSTLSAEGSRVRTSATLASGQGLTENAQGYGESTPVLLASYDHDSSSWRTSQRCLDGELAEFSETWPRSGMTQSGTVYQLPPLVPLMRGTDSGLLPTLTRRDARTLKGGQDRPNRAGGKSLLQWFLDRQYSNGRLNPRFCEWFMGMPQMWTLLPPSETPSSRKSRKSSGAQS